MSQEFGSCIVGARVGRIVTVVRSRLKSFASCNPAVFSIGPPMGT